MTTKSRRAHPTIAVTALVGVAFVSGAGGAVAGSLVTSAQIKDGTIQSVDVKNGTLGSSDFSERARSSLRGATGPQGEVGPQGERGFTGIAIVTLRFGTEVQAPTGTTQTGTAGCIGDEIATGGGVSSEGGGIVVSSHPTSFDTDFPVNSTEPTGWKVEVRNSQSPMVRFLAYAICSG